MTPRAMIGAVDEVIVAMADPTRWRLLNALAARGQGTATSLATEVPVSRPAIVKHLGILGRAGRRPRAPLRARGALLRPSRTRRRDGSLDEPPRIGMGHAPNGNQTHR
jgi:hypothetical protein